MVNKEVLVFVQTIGRFLQTYVFRRQYRVVRTRCSTQTCSELLRNAGCSEEIENNIKYSVMGLSLWTFVCGRLICDILLRFAR
jgi:hypothetical protein